MKSVNNQIDQFVEFQRKNLEPVQHLGNLYAEAFERVARKNYDMMGDLVDFTVQQVQLPVGKSHPQEIYEAQSERTRAFAEMLNSRTVEYMELAGEIGEMMAQGVSQAADQTAERTRNVVATVSDTAAEKAQQAAAKAEEGATRTRRAAQRKEKDAA